jgi:lycopene elongase/hydratase (dihydrobisanhydrobacterioruberin-forming)
MLATSLAYGRMNPILQLVQVSRPILWPVLPLVYYLGLHAARAPLSTVAIVQMLLLTLPANLLGCGLNDIYDYDSDRRSERRRRIWGAVVAESDRAFVWWACMAMAFVLVVGAAFTHNVWNVAATCGFIVAAWAYSVPPVRLKERPPLDALVNGLGFFLFPFAMGYSLGADPMAMPLKYYLLALSVCGIHALATAADFDADLAAGHRTLAVAFGRRAAAAFALATFVLALAIGDYYGLAVRIYLAVGALAALAATLAPSDRVISAVCVAIFVGFIAAAICHVIGI